jgi:hypothetical protein
MGIEIEDRRDEILRKHIESFLNTTGIEKKKIDEIKKEIKKETNQPNIMISKSDLAKMIIKIMIKDGKINNQKEMDKIIDEIPFFTEYFPFEGYLNCLNKVIKKMGQEAPQKRINLGEVSSIFQNEQVKKENGYSLGPRGQKLRELAINLEDNRNEDFFSEISKLFTCILKIKSKFETMQRLLIKELIWRTTEIESPKTKTQGQRYWTVDALKSYEIDDGQKIQHEHVHPLSQVRSIILNNPDRAEEIIRGIRACAVLKTEHERLPNDIWGWARYKDKGIQIYDLIEDREVLIDELIANEIKIWF